MRKTIGVATTLIFLISLTQQPLRAEVNNAVSKTINATTNATTVVDATDATSQESRQIKDNIDNKKKHMKGKKNINIGTSKKINVNGNGQPPSSAKKIAVQKFNTQAQGLIQGQTTVSGLPMKRNTDSVLKNFFSRKEYVPVYASTSSFKQQYVKNNAQKIAPSPSSSNTGENVPVKTGTFFNRIEGYCFFEQNIEMTTASLPVDISCDFKDGYGTLHGSLMIDARGYSLVLKPEYLLINDKEIPVEGYVLTADKSSLNIADEVNRRYLKKVLTATLSAGAKGTLEGYKTYAENKYSTAYLSGDTIVNEKRYPSNYPLITGFLSAISMGIDTIGQIMQAEFQNIPVLFKIYSGKEVYVNLKPKEIGNHSSVLKTSSTKVDVRKTSSEEATCYIIKGFSLNPGERKDAQIYCRGKTLKGNVSGYFVANSDSDVAFLGDTLYAGGKKIPVNVSFHLTGIKNKGNISVSSQSVKTSMIPVGESR